MGRRVAGRELAKTFAAALKPAETLQVAVPNPDAMPALRKLFGEVNPIHGQIQVMNGLNPQAIASVGTLQSFDPQISRLTRLRSGLAPHVFSLCGIIHTLCSDGALRGLQDIAIAPLYPWDALVCTSTAGKSVVQAALELRLEAMAARLGVAPRCSVELPQLPVIPLVVAAGQPYHPALSRVERRRLARRELGIGENAFAVAFVGRLSFHSKAHPLALYRALAALASEHGPITLIECGHLFNESIAKAYEDLRQLFPGLDFHLVGGLEPASEAQKWQVLAAADVFSSPADNLQETFGISLLEAMAAELPLVVSDWDGYRDLVEHGVTGFLVPTQDVLTSLSPIDPIDMAYQDQAINYDWMIGLRSLGVVVDHQAMVGAFQQLLDSRQLRETMATAGLKRLRSHFAAPVVSNKYRQLWGELAQRREQARRSPAMAPLPALAPATGRIFAGYASQPFQAKAASQPADGIPADLARGTTSGEQLELLLQGRLKAVLEQLQRQGCLSQPDLLALDLSPDQAMYVLAALVKLGVLVAT